MIIRANRSWHVICVPFKGATMADKFMIYGATGYTGRLTARTAVQQGLRPILAGRNREKVAALAQELGLEGRALALDDAAGLDAALREVAVVLHCAGPFSQTYPPMAAACLRTGTHYLDITGEIAEHEALAGRDAEARAAGVMLLPSAGYDVVPSDCLAAHLKRRLPSATHLALAFSSAGGSSRGTAITGTEMVNRAGLVRRNGVITPVPAGWKSRTVDFGRGPVACVTIPWGDLATAYRSTGIPNIETYVAVPKAAQWALKSARVLGKPLSTPMGQRLLRALVGLMPEGPTDAQRAGGYSLLWAEVTDESGNRAVSRMRTPHAYTLTAEASLLIVRRVLAGDIHPGYQTPASAYGADLVMELAGVTREAL